MKDLIDSIRLQVYQRMSSPLFGSFVIAWVCWNHRYLFILFSGEPIQTRLQLAHMLVYPDESVLWLRAVVWPLVSSVAFILIYPYPSKWLFKYWHKKQIELKKLRDEIEGETLLTKEESRKITRDMVAIREKYEEQVERLAREVDALKTPGGALAGDQSTVEQQRQRISALEAELNRRDSVEKQKQSDRLGGFDVTTQKQVLELLKLVAKRDLVSADLLMKEMQLSRARSLFLIDSANSCGLIEHPDGMVPGTIGLSPGGRAFLNERGLLV